MHAVIKRNPSSDQRGFSLVELAIVLAIIAFVSGGAIAAFRAQLSYTRGAEAREQLREAREALIAYAISNFGNPDKVLPCPASNASGVANTAANCDTEYKGFLPWQTLGLPATDPWGRSLRYAVSSGLVTPATFALSTTGSLDVFVNGTNIDPGGAGQPKSIAFSVWSTGEDAINASETSVSSSSAASGSSSSASVIVTKNTVIAEAPGSDDIVEWVSRYVLFGKLMAAGRTVQPTVPSSSASSSTSSSSSSSSS